MRVSHCLARRAHTFRFAVQCRSLHQEIPLRYDVEKGFGDFLPPRALKTVHQFQQGLLQRLNDEVRGTECEGAEVSKTISKLAGSRDATLAFNYASLALNNHFFLDQLKPPSSKEETHQADISSALLFQIRQGYGSLAQFKSTFSAAAMGTFTSGWIWFVTDANGNTAILPTYGPGSLLVRSRSLVHKQLEQSVSFQPQEEEELSDPMKTRKQIQDIFHLEDEPDVSIPDPSTTPPLGEDELLRWARVDQELSEVLRNDASFAKLVEENPEFAHLAEDIPDIRRQLGLPDRNDVDMTEISEEYEEAEPQAPEHEIPNPSPSSSLSQTSINSHKVGGNTESSFSGSSSPSSNTRSIHTSAIRPAQTQDPSPYSSPDATKGHKGNIYMGDTLYPLFCLSVYEHAWMSAGYGVWGKEEWIKKFWTVVDWQRVSELYDKCAVMRPHLPGLESSLDGTKQEDTVVLP